MNQDLFAAKQQLATGQFTCVLCKDGHTITATARGVRPLVDLLQEGTLPGYSAADKVVGKATAFLYVQLGVKAVYAPVISAPALAVLQRFGIDASCDSVVDAIFNRDHTGFCPMETAVRDIDDPAAAHQRVLEVLARGIHKK
jgi:hypothetical protein